MKIIVSELTRKYLDNKYPKLTDKEIEFLIFFGDIEKENIEKTFSNGTRSFETKHTLRISKDLARMYDVDEVIDLIPDSDGIFYTILSDKTIGDC